MASLRYGNQLVAIVEYDKQLRPVNNIDQANNYQQILAWHSRTWAANGNLQHSYDYESGYGGQIGSMSQFQQAYSYDGVNRLIGMNDTGGYNRSFSYDRYGNRSVSASSGVPWSGLTPYSGAGANPFNAGNNRLNAGGYDAAGNQTIWDRCRSATMPRTARPPRRTACIRPQRMRTTGTASG